MKKIYTLISLSLIGAFTYKAKAQITVTTADMPSIGTTFVTGYDTAKTSLSVLTLGSKGANVTWNYATLPTSYRDTTVFVNPNTTSYASSFPGSNLADSVFGTAGYNYTNSSGTAFNIVGSEQSIQGVMVAVAFNPNITELNLPANYGDLDGGVTVASVPAFAYSYLIFDSVKGVIHTTYADTIDAWGSITTPDWNTTFQSLRQKHYEVDYDSLFVHNSTSKSWQLFQAQKNKMYQYRWYAKNIGDLAATITTADSTYSKATAMQWYYGLPDGVNEVSQAHSTLVYPNPATNQINFHYSAQNAQNIFVYDITGRVIGQTEMINGIATLNTSSYSSGMYFYHVTDKSGNILDNGKFSVL
jgi:hypothetical protein